MLGFVAPGNLPGEESAEGSSFFRDKIHPLLEANCFECHGGGDKLKGGFRLTSRAGLLRGGDLGPAYDEDSPGDSLLLKMVRYADDEHQMPPKAKLADDAIVLLGDWLARGAPYDPGLEIEGAASERSGFTVTEEDRAYWAYRPVEKPEVPRTTDPAWSENPVDAFLRAAMEAQGLAPNGPADARQLARRIHYDLLGLPPEPGEVERFAARFDEDPDAAVAGLVDELLARPQYGEKWARHWLDLVRYAESNGFERDNPKPGIWRYRDYVVEAFNRDKPYDRFVLEQLAGDEIAEPTMESLAATGYHRLMQWDDEPADRKQHVYDVLADNVLVTSETFLGTTLGCARCHDHKADPVSQKDYYSFMAFFHGITPYRTEGTIRHWISPEEKAAFERERARRARAIQEKADRLEAEMLAWLDEVQPLRKEGAAGKGGDGAANRTRIYVEDGRGEAATWSYVTSPPAPGWQEVGSQNFKSWTKGRGGFGRPGAPGASSGPIGTEWAGGDIWMRADFGASRMPGNLLLDIHHGGDVEVYLNGARIHRAKGRLDDYQTIELGPGALDAFQTGNNVLAVHCRQTQGAPFVDVALRSGPGRVGSLLARLERGGGRLKKKLAARFGRDIVAEWREAGQSLVEIRKETPGVPLNTVTEAGPEPLPLHVHLRGSAHAPGDEVAPAFPAVLGEEGSEPVPADVSPVVRDGVESSGRRLALAKWMTDPANPLVARVMVNRIWQHHFGRGLVPSTNDFGKLGEDPTHPELLDWLAARFVEEGWSVKEMHRLLMNSRAYRMSSAPDPDKLAADPGNEWFWRFNMRRLTAEEIRDSMLALSGELNLERGGPWVRPPLPEEVVATASRPDKAWPLSPEEKDHHRRSLYIHVKRSLRFQMLADFDQAATDTPCAVRFATTVPTQALTMLNSALVNEQAEAFATRLREEAGQGVAERVRKGLRLVFQREPMETEVKECLVMVRKFRDQHGLSEEEAMERFALLALNLNEFVYLD